MGFLEVVGAGSPGFAAHFSGESDQNRTVVLFCFDAIARPAGRIEPGSRHGFVLS
jgi:hypothetical protein